LKGKEETVNPGEIQFDQEKGIVIITVNGKRTGNNYELGFLTNFFNNNLSVFHYLHSFSFGAISNG